MKFLMLLAALVPLAMSASVQNYPMPAPTAPSSYGEQGSAGYGDNDGYAQPQQKCQYYDETKYTEHCEDFEERTCTTTHRESCSDVRDQNCRGVVSAKQVRKCFDVTEQRCSLKEDVRMETIQMPVTVQKCRKVPERGVGRAS